MLRQGTGSGGQDVDPQASRRTNDQEVCGLMYK